MNNKNKKQQSIVLPIMLVTAVMMLLLLAGWQLAKTEFEDIVPIENVEIEGNFNNLSLRDVRQAITAQLDGGYFSQDLEQVRTALLQLPWVEDASIRRQWPSGLYIKVIEKSAIAYWGDDAMLSASGELFTPVPLETGWPLPALAGPQGQHAKVLAFYIKVSEQLSANGIDVQRLTLDPRRAWSITLSGKDFTQAMEVRLGRSDTQQRLQRLVAVLSRNYALDFSNVDVIDMRYPNGFAMRSRQPDDTDAGSARASKREVSA